MAKATKQTVWISWCGSEPERYDFDSLEILNAFLKGITETADQTAFDGVDWEQYDSLEEVRADFPNYEE